MQLTELTEIRTLFNNFKNLSASELQLKAEECSERIGKEINF